MKEVPNGNASAHRGKHPVVVVPDDKESVRALAIKRIERKRRFHMRAVGAGLVAVLLVVIWAISEYNNAGGWPTNGFSESSGISHTWNSWIIYPLIALGVGIAIDAWHTYREKPISEQEISQEMDRLTGATK